MRYRFTAATFLAAVAGIFALLSTTVTTPANAAGGGVRRVDGPAAPDTQAGGFTVMGICTAGVICGHVRSELPNGVLRAASFGEGPDTCVTWNSGTYRCRIYVLNYQQTSDAVGLKDADGLMVPYAYDWHDGYNPHRISGGTWTRIHDNQYAVCVDRRQGVPLCS